MMRYARQFVRQRKTIVVLSSLLGGLMLLSLYPGSGSSADDGGTVEAAQGDALPGTNMTAISVKLIGSVALVIGLLYAAMYAIKRLGPGFKLGGIKQDAVSVLHKRHIAPKKAIYILKIGQRSMVVGVTDTQISHLADLSAEDLESIEAEGSHKGRSFRQYLLGGEPPSRSTT